MLQLELMVPSNLSLQLATGPESKPEYALIGMEGVELPTAL
jgi:hypothetical protein